MALSTNAKLKGLFLEKDLFCVYNKDIENETTYKIEGVKAMFFKKKSKEEKKDLLYKANIKVNCTAQSKEEVIITIGNMLVETGYVNEAYVEGMLEREKSFSTYMGCGLAIPHGVEAAKKQVKTSGIAVMTFPEGVLWGDEKANLVVGIASVGEEHLEILSNISEKIIDEATASKLINGDVDTVYNILSGKE